MTSYLLLRVILGQLSPDGEVCRLCLGRLSALGKVDCSRQSAMPVPISAQLQPSRLTILVMGGWTVMVSLHRKQKISYGCNFQDQIYVILVTVLEGLTLVDTKLC